MSSMRLPLHVHMCPTTDFQHWSNTAMLTDSSYVSTRVACTWVSQQRAWLDVELWLFRYLLFLRAKLVVFPSLLLLPRREACWLDFQTWHAHWSFCRNFFFSSSRAAFKEDALLRRVGKKSPQSMIQERKMKTATKQKLTSRSRIQGKAIRNN